MSFVDTSHPSYMAVAWNESVDPAVAVVVGEYGAFLYSTGKSASGTSQIYDFVLADSPVFRDIFAVARGENLFIASTTYGYVLRSISGEIWEPVEAYILARNLHGIINYASTVWLAVGETILGDSGIVKSSDDGITWSVIANSASKDLYAIAMHDTTIMAVGEDGVVLVSTNAGNNWVEKASGTTEHLRAIVYGADGFYIVGDNSTILYTADGTSFASRTSPVSDDFRGIAYSGELLLAVGYGGTTITSADGIYFESRNVDGDIGFLGVGYGDDVFLAVGEGSKITYSIAGTGRVSFDLFQPISDIYRAQCFAQFGAYMIYGGCLWFEGEEDEKVWNSYPRRIMNAAPGSVNDFESVGWYFADLPGTGILMDMTSIQGGVLIAESDQLSLLTDAGSVQVPWMYHDDYGQGLKPVSNLTSFNGTGFVVSDDGLIYSATTAGVNRLQTFFDLSEFEDWDASGESVWLQFDPIYQVLFLFRQKSPWTMWLVNDSTGGVTELAIPEVTISAVVYEPRSAFIIDGLMDGIHAGYAPVSGSSTDLVTVNLDLDGAITGIDEPSAGETSHHAGDLQTGSFRLQALGGRGEINEVKVWTWANPGSTVRPDIAVLVREETDQEWQTDTDPMGTIAVGTSSVTGTGTAWSRYIALAPETSGAEFTLPWLVDQCEVLIDDGGSRTAASYTKMSDYVIRIDADLTGTEKLYVNPGPTRPFVRGRVGDYIFTEYGYHRITVVNTATDLELDWYPPQQTTGTYIPAQEIPAGGERGDGKLIFGLGRGFDQIMLQVLIIPHGNVDATGAKITSLELGYAPTGPEMKTDSGG